MKQIILLFACLFALQGLAKADDDRAITVDQLPQKAQEFIQKYFPKNEISLAKMEKDFWEKKYEVVFVNGEKAEFLKDGSWEKVDCKYSTVPTGIVPQAIKDYVSKRYPENFADGIGLLAEVFEGDEATLVGFTSSEGYTFERSKALRGEQWCGLVVDLDNQSEQAEKKIKAWCQQVKKEFA